MIVWMTYLRNLTNVDTQDNKSIPKRLHKISKIRSKYEKDAVIFECTGSHSELLKK